MENENIKRLRKQKGLTKKEFAKQVGMSIRQYQRVELKGHIPNAKTAIRIAKKLGTTVEELFS